MLNELLAKLSGLPVEKISAETERDRYMTAEEALAYGIIDEVLELDESGKKKPGDKKADESKPQENKTDEKKQ